MNMNNALNVFASVVFAATISGCFLARPTQSDVDANINAYMKKHADVVLGQEVPTSSQRVPFTLQDGITSFTNGLQYVLNGKVNRIQIYQDIDKSTPLTEANARIYKELEALAGSFGLDKNYFKRHHVFGVPGRNSYLRDWYKSDGEISPSDILFLLGYDLKEANIGQDNFWRYVIELNNFGTNDSNVPR